MKISKIYAEGGRFKNIDFNEGFNVIIGKIKDSSNKGVDTHNLGKSSIIDVIDYLLLKKIDLNHIFKKHGNVFNSYIFYIEIKLNNGSFLTIRRPVEKNTKISFKSTPKQANMAGIDSEDAWDYYNIAIADAITIFNDLLAFSVIPNYSYRKSMTYFLRKQEDYRDVFQLQKFAQGKHKEWKPLLLDLLGFDGSKFLNKLDSDENIAKHKILIKGAINEAPPKSETIDQINAKIQIIQQRKDSFETNLNNFQFSSIDIDNTIELANKIEIEVANLNTEIYNTRYEVERLHISLDNTEELVFDIDDVKTIFTEFNFLFPEKIIKSYENLTSFNKSISEERRKYIHEQLSNSEAKLELLEDKLKTFDAEKSKILSVIGENDSMKKFKLYQQDLARVEGELISLQAKKTAIDKLNILQKELIELKSNNSKLKIELESMVASGNSIYTHIREVFNYIIKDVLNQDASIFIELNSSDNIEFRASFFNSDQFETTSEDRGFTYRKILCAAFDLSLLQTYSTSSFYRFAFHDGIFESLDNRKKSSFINIARTISKEDNIQYILTLNDSDLFDDENGNSLIQKDEIVLELNDINDSGKLFEISF